MAKKNDTSILFEDAGTPLTDFNTPDTDNVNPDPVAACLDSPTVSGKIKAGYYLPRNVLEKLDEIYLTLRLKKEPVESKSQLVEMSFRLLFADLENEEKSAVLRALRGR